MWRLQAALTLASLDHAAVGKPIPDERLHDCVNVILSYQNADGGWATYENTRSYAILEVWSLHTPHCPKPGAERGHRLVPVHIGD